MKLGELLKAAKAKEIAANAANQDGVVFVPIEMVVPNPYQPRKIFDDASIRELADSISQHGVLQPLVVRAQGGKYEVIVGERRLRACRLLGWDEVPAIIRDVPDRTVAEMALIENLQREDLHFLEEAEGLERLIREFGITQEELGRQLGLSQSTIANKMRLLKLENRVREFISREMISERHARALLKLETEEERLRVLEMIVKSDLNVRETERLIEGIVEEKKVGPKKRQTMVRVYKDVRLFRNSLLSLVESIEAAGIPVKIEEDNSPEEYIVTIKIRPMEKTEKVVQAQ